MFPEHSFIASCLRNGLTIDDLRFLTYVDVMKILISFIPEPEKEKLASQSDIDKFLG